MVFSLEQKLANWLFGWRIGILWTWLGWAHSQEPWESKTRLWTLGTQPTCLVWPKTSLTFQMGNRAAKKVAWLSQGAHNCSAVTDLGLESWSPDLQARALFRHCSCHSPAPWSALVPWTAEMDMPEGNKRGAEGRICSLKFAPYQIGSYHLKPDPVQMPSTVF